MKNAVKTILGYALVEKEFILQQEFDLDNVKSGVVFKTEQCVMLRSVKIKKLLFVLVFMLPFQ